MKHFKVDTPKSWSAYKIGVPIPFEVNRPRRIKFQAIANSPMEVWIADNEQMEDGILAAVGSDKMSVEFTADKKAFVAIKAQKNSEVFVNIKDLDQTIQASSMPAYTNLAPRPSTNPELENMMALMRYNQEKMEQERAKERLSLQRQIDALAAKKEPVVQEVKEDEGQTDAASTE